MVIGYPFGRMNMTRRKSMKTVPKGIIVILMIFLSTGMNRSAGAQPIRGDVLPPDVLPVIILQGEDYQMGVQYGQQAGAFIEREVIAAWAGALKRFKRSEILKSLRANQHYIHAYTPENIDIMRGIADGAASAGYAVEYLDVLLLNCTLPKPETSHLPEGSEDDPFPPKGCSVCSAWGSATRDGKLIGMDTLDSPDALYGVIIVTFPDRGNRTVCGAQAGEIGDHFLMNDRGLFVGNSGGGGSPRDKDNDYGLSWSCSLPYIARFANSAEEAKSMITGWKINIPENFHFVDVSGNGYVVEKSAAIQAVREPGDFGETDFLFSTNNYLHRTMRVTKEGGFIGEHGGYGSYSAPRNHMLWDMLHNYHGEIDVEFMKMILRFPGDPPPYPPEAGWDAKICRPTNSWVSVVQPDDGDGGVAHICTGPAGKVIHSSTASDGTEMKSSYPYIDGTHTFFSLQLKETPEKMVEAAKDLASDHIAAAYQKLMHMDYSHAGYGPLKAVYATANIHYYDGCNRLNRALTSTGNEMLNAFGGAATAFYRAQARALQVIEAVEPPPTSPSDLGLRPFGGSWADWETNVGELR